MVPAKVIAGTTLIYSTVTDIAKFHGLSISRPSAFAT